MSKEIAKLSKISKAAESVFYHGVTPDDVSLQEVQLMMNNRDKDKGDEVWTGFIFPALGIASTFVLFGGMTWVVLPLVGWMVYNSVNYNRASDPKTFNKLLIQASNKAVPSRYHEYALYLQRKKFGKSELDKWDIARFEKRFPAKAVSIEERKPALMLTTTSNYEIQPTHTGGYDNAIEIFESTQKDWIEKETDILIIAKYPLLSSPREPLTREFHEKLLLSKTLKPSPNTPYDPSHPFIAAVASLKATWDSLWMKAQTAQYEHFTKEEEDSLQTAYKMLKMAVDGHGSLNERQIAYKRAMKELKRLIVIPESVRLELETSIGLKEVE